MTDEQVIDENELYRLASLVGCEPEDEAKHRKQLLDFVMRQFAEQADKAYHNGRKNVLKALDRRNDSRYKDGMFHALYVESLDNPQLWIAKELDKETRADDAELQKELK